MDNVKATASWYDENADDYTRHVRDKNDSVWHSYYEKPAMFALLPAEMTGLRVLSLGCGSGEDCQEFASRGAKVVGVDISEKLIEKARAAYPECEYHVMDMQNIDFEDESFDVVYSSLAVHYLDDWGRMLKNTTRVLKPGGIFQFSMVHPIYSGMDYFDVTENSKSRGIVRIKVGKQQTIYGDYFSKQGATSLGANMKGVVTYHKTLQMICDLCIESGFEIERIVEPFPLPEMKRISPEVYEKLSKIPDFIIFRLKKI